MQKKLNFYSCLNKKYSPSFFLPDFLRENNGAISVEDTLNRIVNEEYGQIDDNTVVSTVKDVTEKHALRLKDYNFCGKCRCSVIEFSFEKDGIIASFNADVLSPTENKNPAFVVMADFQDGLPTKYCPVEEILDRGVGLAHIYYKDVSSDDGDFNSGIAKIFCDRNKAYAPGKIALWAYALKVVGQFLVESGIAVQEKLYCAGHSRLGKTALLACAQYKIFAGCFVNCSGCCGAAISREKKGESIKVITDVFPYWFTGNFKKYAERENEMPFDQHYLMAAVAPRKVFIVAASEDDWADADAQYLCAEAATVAYNEMGMDGLKRQNKMLEIGERNVGGQICFYLRKGPHFFSREDWNFYIDCIEKL